MRQIQSSTLVLIYNGSDWKCHSMRQHLYHPLHGAISPCYIIYIRRMFSSSYGVPPSTYGKLDCLVPTSRPGSKLLSQMRFNSEARSVNSSPSTLLFSFIALFACRI